MKMSITIEVIGTNKHDLASDLRAALKGLSVDHAFFSRLTRNKKAGFGLMDFKSGISAEPRLAYTAKIEGSKHV